MHQHQFRTRGLFALAAAVAAVGRVHVRGQLLEQNEPGLLGLWDDLPSVSGQRPHAKFGSHKQRARQIQKAKRTRLGRRRAQHQRLP